MITNTEINTIFKWCVEALEELAFYMHTTYEAVNVWIFCVIVPLIIVVQFILLLFAAFMLLKRLPPKRLAGATGGV
jgi:hypothetical protein